MKLSIAKSEISRLSCLIFVVTAFAVSTPAQNTDAKTFAAIPPAMQSRLIERLDLYVAYQRAKQYDQLYDLLSRSAIQKVFRGQSKAEFTKAYQKGDNERTSTRVVQFTPSATAKEQNADGGTTYLIYGKASLFEMGEFSRMRSIVIRADLQDGDWYFSAFGNVLNN
ncbi:MAG TPA: hypothetical protein VE863_16560 [Pyrinomonadaceae bacterium]|jgi:hypothetical protein|nr:hypothetical protein [Pyrinomonadaceae bacterium]